MNPTFEAMRLEELARVLRTLASIEDHQLLKHDLARLAEKCEELAATAPQWAEAHSEDFC